MLVEEVDQAIIIGNNLVIWIFAARVEALALAVRAFNKPRPVDITKNLAVALLQLNNENRILLDQNQVDIPAADTKIRQDQIQPIEPIEPVRQ